MTRELVWRTACAILGPTFLLLGCSGSEPPTIAPGENPWDGAVGDRGVAPLPDAAQPPETGSEAERQDVPGSPDVPGDLGAAADAAPTTRITVSILDPKTINGPDAGATSVPVVPQSSRFAPTVSVLVESQSDDPSGDVISSVKASLAGGKDSTPVASASLNQSQYTVVPESSTRNYLFSDTPLDISSVATDYYNLRVVATTTGGATATVTMRVFVDGGPVINVTQPADGASVKGSVVATALISDMNSGVTSVTFSIGQYQLDAAAISTNGSRYTATIDFNSFNPPLDGNQILTVRATNGNGVTAVASCKFNIDNLGPSISDTKPATGDLIGKVISIEAKVTDPAGVMASSVVAVVANGDAHFEVNLVLGSDGIYRKLFDTTQLPIYAIFPSISFRAQDLLGNQSSVGYLVSLDNTPPILDLDPPDDFRLLRKDSNVQGGYACSWPFDPVGPDAIDDGATVTQLFDVRARIEDQGNSPQTGKADYVPISAVDPAAVRVLVLADTSRPLVVDTSDPPDGICDDINPELVPTTDPKSSTDAQLINMVSMPVNVGAGDFTKQAGVVCSGNDATAPDPLCLTVWSAAKQKQMTYSLGYGPSLPSIWTIGPVVNDALQCAGRQFDASNNLGDGWACVAVQASDKLGNMQVSRPLRICVAAKPGSTGCAAVAMPNCTGTLIKSAGGLPVVDSSQPCKPWASFPKGESLLAK